MSSSSPPPPPPPSSSSNHDNPLLPLTTADSGGGGGEKNHSFTPTEALYHDAVRSADVFWKLLHQLHASLGNRIRVPKIGGKTLDLHLLFVEVTSRGGFEKVVSDRRWKEVIAAFNFPSTITSASFVIRKYYVSLLYQFEEAYYFGKQVLQPQPQPQPQPQISESAQPASPEPQQGSSVIGVIDGKFDSGYLVSVKIGGEVLKGVLYHIPQAPQISETSNASAITPEKTKKSQKSSRDSSRNKKSRKSYSLSFSEDYARVQPVCYEQEEKVTTNNKASSRSKLTGVERQAYLEEEVNGDAAC
uniref:ARID domain-containing protein n=1 Tax=Kalanchoe fedtschenkoi TaxID=63787 RepID=A0A7N0UN21_KALFE